MVASQNDIQVFCFFLQIKRCGLHNSEIKRTPSASWSVSASLIAFLQRQPNPLSPTNDWGWRRRATTEIEAERTKEKRSDDVKAELREGGNKGAGQTTTLVAAGTWTQPWSTLRCAGQQVWTTLVSPVGSFHPWTSPSFHPSSSLPLFSRPLIFAPFFFSFSLSNKRWRWSILSFVTYKHKLTANHK